MHPRKAEALKAQALQTQAEAMLSIDERLSRLEKKVDLLLKAITGNPKPVAQAEKKKAAKKADEKPADKSPEADSEKQVETPPADEKPAE